MYKIKVEWKSQEAQNKLAAHFIFLLNVNSYFYAPSHPPAPFCYLIEEEFHQNVKVWNYWTITRYMIMISINYTSPSMLFQSLWQRKKCWSIKCWSIKFYVLIVPMTMTPPPPACKHFIVVKWVSFFLLAYGEEIWN